MVSTELLPCPFSLHDRVRKIKGTWWEGKVVGFYSTDNNQNGVAVQLDMVPNGPVQIYPAAALERAPSLEPKKSGATPEAEARDAGVCIGIAMTVAFLIRDYDQPTIALEWWAAAGLTIEQCERIGLDEYDLGPIRAALATPNSGETR